ncbi:YcgN family cysteine cluster protein [Alphaproteobacteria bacterium]|nr:YcgN family cysteine cluster protein [Alphaproteobacteria bacterium]
MDNSDFWKQKLLTEMSREEWELLCDGCGKCCVLKLQDVDTDETYYTDVSCKLLDCQTAQCSQYETRKSYVPDCIILTPSNLAPLSWMPDSCSYKLIHNGNQLPDWHPLITGNKNSTRESGNSVAQRVIPETDLENEDDLLEHIIDWDEILAK